MKSFQYIIRYRRADGSYLEVASIWLNERGCIETVIGIMTGQPVPEGAKVVYRYNPLSLRPLQLGDSIKYAGGECSYMPAPVPAPAVVECKPPTKRTRRSKKTTTTVLS